MKPGSNNWALTNAKYEWKGLFKFLKTSVCYIMLRNQCAPTHFTQFAVEIVELIIKGIA